jgi:hypothetical protein
MKDARSKTWIGTRKRLFLGTLNLDIRVLGEHNLGNQDTFLVEINSEKEYYTKDTLREHT